MKLTKTLLSFFIAFSFVACSSSANQGGETEGTDSTAVEESAAEDYSNMTEVDLTEYGISASIMTPGDNKGKLEIEETSWGSLTVKVGEKFGMEIVPFGLTLEEMKAEMDQGGVYEIEMVEEDASYVLYKRTIPGSEVEAEYHFFMNTEIGEEIYEIKTMADMELKESHARYILKSAKSFKAKDAV